MDTFFFRRLRQFFLIAFVAFAGVLCAPLVYASSCPALDNAMRPCQSFIGGAPGYTCVDTGSEVDAHAGDGSVQGRWGYSPCAVVPPADPCAGMSSMPAYVESGKYLKSQSFCAKSPPQSDGSTVQCAMSIVPENSPTFNPNTGQWNTMISLVNSDQICTSDGGVTSGDGSSPNPRPPVPQAPALPLPAVPKICDSFACFDPSNNSVCTSTGGGTVCNPGPGMGCVSDSEGTICRSAPNQPAAPLPPAPPVSPISDPPSQLVDSTKVQQVDSTTGLPIVTAITVYSGGTSTPSSGATSGDSKPPASSSSSPSAAKGTYAGGTNCDTPPVCSGDAVMCGASRTQWATTCQLHTDLAGTSSAPSADALANGGPYDKNSVWTTPTLGNTVGDQANAGNYNAAGLGAATDCPMQDLSVPLWHGQSFVVPFAKGCTPASWLGWLVLGFAYYFAAMITAGLKT